MRFFFIVCFCAQNAEIFLSDLLRGYVDSVLLAGCVNIPKCFYFRLTLRFAKYNFFKTKNNRFNSDDDDDEF